MLNLQEIEIFRMLIKSQDIKDILKGMFQVDFVIYQRFAKYSLDNGLITSDELMHEIKSLKV